MVQLFQVVTVQEAWSKLWPYIEQFKRELEHIPLLQTLGRVLAVDITASFDVPGFARSTVDGYALKAKDTYGASESLPALITITGEVLMGQEATQKLVPGEGVSIPTGGMLPDQSDAVVMIEYTEEMDSSTITVFRPVAPGENVIHSGEDVRVGDLLLPLGWQLRPQDIGVLAGVGVPQVSVYARPKVGIISTGDEIIKPDRAPKLGQVRDVNSYTLYSLVQECGGIGKLYPIAPDSFEKLRQIVEQALAENDLLVISGGSSVGIKDATARVIDSLGEPGVLVHGVSVRPGKPTVLGMVGKKPIIGLPGHPVSAMVIFDLFIKPILRYYQGVKRGKPEAAVRARLACNVASGPGREDFIRAMLEDRLGKLWAVPVLGKAGLITTMVKADGIFRIPLDKEGVMEGEYVNVKLF
ncbi:MAG: gephyrin-like molybdotransferase Glp [Carboxydocellales bacterium]